jgi:hypothetical protein
VNCPPDNEFTPKKSSSKTVEKLEHSKKKQTIRKPESQKKRPKIKRFKQPKGQKKPKKTNKNTLLFFLLFCSVYTYFLTPKKGCRLLAPKPVRGG